MTDGIGKFEVDPRQVRADVCNVAGCLVAHVFVDISNMGSELVVWKPVGIVLEAVEVEAERNGVPREVTLDRVRSYAREIVPSFNAYIYFRLGYWLARRFAQLLYRVRLGVTDAAALARRAADQLDAVVTKPTRPAVPCGG